MSTATDTSGIHDQLFGQLFSGARVPKRRTMREFAEQEIVVADGPFKDRRFRCERQPFSALWFDVCMEGFTELVITGPSQSGKTLIGFVIPILWHLFEVKETVIAAVPDEDIVADKWEQDILPVIEKTRFRDLLPTSGQGSRGGRKLEAIRFKHGATLRFMTAGGSDKSRAAFTSRVVCMTETDGFDQRTSTSAEADKIAQIEARQRSFPALQRRIYKECTLTTDQGHTWQRYQAGTASKIVLQCVHCKDWVTLEREDFKGWKEAKNDVEAAEESTFFCNSCGEQWSEGDRIKANSRPKLLHKGQSIDKDGTIQGERKRTRTVGFRWSAVNNLLVPAGDVGIDEFNALRAVDEDNEQRRLSQFVWAVPYKPKELEEVELDPVQLSQRVAGYGRGVCPDDVKYVTVGVDVNKPVLHWTAMAWTASETGHVIDYGKFGIKHKQMPFDKAIAYAVNELSRRLGDGWSRQKIDRVLLDCRWETTACVKAIKSIENKESRKAWRPYMGMGKGHWTRNYTHPAKVYGDVIWLGNRAYQKIDQTHHTIFTHADANHWKTWLHSRLALDIEEDSSKPGRITLFSEVSDVAHLEFCKHLTAEKEVATFEQGRGYIKVWEAVRSQNHWLDATYMACVAAHTCGFAPLIDRKRTPVKRSVSIPAASGTSYGDGFSFRNN